MVIYFVVAIVQMLVDQGLFSQNKSHLFFLFSGICIYQFRSDRFKKHEKSVV